MYSIDEKLTGTLRIYLQTLFTVFSTITVILTGGQYVCYSEAVPLFQWKVLSLVNLRILISPSDSTIPLIADPNACVLST